jgi:23S rRNA (adenine-N6)-dimethyltransferase
MKRLDEYSQVFLRSPRLVAELIGHSDIKKSDLVLDIGAGTGVITSVLAGRCKQVYAIEPEPRAADTLRKNTAGYGNVKVTQGSFLDYPLPPGGYKVFANIPFHLSSPIVKRLTEAANPPKSIYLIVQKQFANKLLANDRHFTSQLGAIVAPWWKVRIRKPLRKTDFTPPPAVDTVLLEIKRRTEPLVPAAHAARYHAFIKQSFEAPGAFHKLPLTKAKISPELTPSMLTGEQWANLYQLTLK